MLKKHIACFLRIALLAAFVNALVPTVSYLFAASTGKQVVEICTSFGLKMVLLEASEHPFEPAGHEQNIRCQFCLASQDAAAFILPLVAPSPLVLHVSAPGFAVSFPPEVRKRWPEGRPRAPPVLSA
ncbi:MAG: hypothetical protein H6R19_341 [Proteobacteria bacterium]|nr:hypothetical protein [Pseudomonadota bacterium]